MRNPANRMTDTNAGHRCARCRLVLGHCLCDLIPRVETSTHVVLILHQMEDRKTSNTGRLALRCLPNSTLVIRGAPGHPIEDSHWNREGNTDTVLLFPHPDARPIEAWRDHPRPITLVVPDGTWRQAQRVRRRVPGLASVPCARVSRAAPSAYRLRTTWDPKRLATLEAIAEAVGVLEGPDARAALLGIFDIMVERSLRVRCPAPRAPGAVSTLVPGLGDRLTASAL
jgi:DTW domain-containing protein